MNTPLMLVQDLLSCSAYLYIMDIGLLWWLSGKEPPCQCRRHRRLKFSRVQGHTQRLLSGDVQRNPACLDRVTRRSLMYISCLRVFTRQNGYPYIPAVHSPSQLSQQLYQRSYSPWGSKVQACSQTIRVTISSPREPALCSHQDPVSLLLPQPHSSMEPVSACVGCHNSVYRLSGLNHSHLFSHSSGGWKSKIKESADSVPSAASLLGLQKATSPCVLTWSFFWVHTSLVFLCVYMFPSYRDTSQIG